MYKLRKTLFLCFVVPTLVSCEVLPKKDTFKKAYSKISLTVVGTKKESIYKTDYQVSAIPKLETGIKIKISSEFFNKKVYKKYSELSKIKQVNHKVVFNDSLKTLPKFYEILIEDKVTLVEELKRDNLIVDYIKENERSSIVVGLQVVMDREVIELIEKGDDFFLVSNTNKKKLIEVFNQNKLIGKIDLDKATILGYKLASFCWMLNVNETPELGGIVDYKVKCKGKTKNNINKLDYPEKMEFKF